jgi:hypothetical protein
LHYAGVCSSAAPERQGAAGTGGLRRSRRAEPGAFGRLPPGALISGSLLTGRPPASSRRSRLAAARPSPPDQLGATGPIWRRPSLGKAGQPRILNLCALTYSSGGPCDRGNLCPRRPRERGGGRAAWSGWGSGVRCRHPRLRAAIDGIRAIGRFLHRTPRPVFATPDRLLGRDAAPADGRTGTPVS